MIKRELSLGNDVNPFQSKSRIYFLVIILCFSTGCLAGSLAHSFFGFGSFLNDYLGAAEIASQNPICLFFNFNDYPLLIIQISFYGLQAQLISTLPSR